MDILPQLLVHALIAGSIYALASSGLSLTYGLLKILNFAHGHFMMVGAYIFYFFCIQHEYNIAVSIVATILFTVVFAAACLKVFVLPFARYSFILSFVTTLSLATILESGVSMWFGVNVKSLPILSSNESIEISGVYITPVQIFIIVSALVLLGFAGFVIHLTPVGRKIRALSERSHAAESLGISKNLVTYGVFIAGSLLAVFAGIMVGIETNMQPTMGNSYTIKAFAAMILGGLGNMWGTVAGSYLLGLVENLSIGLDFWGYSIPAGYKDAFAFVIILIVLLVRPQGLFGSKQRSS